MSESAPCALYNGLLRVGSGGGVFGLKSSHPMVSVVTIGTASKTSSEDLKAEVHCAELGPCFLSIRRTGKHY